MRILRGIEKLYSFATRSQIVHKSIDKKSRCRHNAFAFRIKRYSKAIIA
jgi:hypothetical protein